MDQKFVIIGMILMAGTTYLIRMLPLAFFKKKIENEWIQDFFYYIPYCVLAAMTFPAIFTSISSNEGLEGPAVQHITAAVVATIVSMILAWRKHGLVTVAIFGVLAAIATEWLWKFMG
ncbi:MAG: AzlD domain-containing protein [Bacteroidales bacterium]|nr:AzlD domain-containing protein [Bacteroidales bacterium]